MPQGDHEFYIGWQERAPARTASRMHRVVLALYLGAAAMAVALVLLQNPFPPAAFEFGTVRSFAGTVGGEAHPWLVVARPGLASPGREASRYPLVAPGKLGAPAALRERIGSEVELTGTLVWRDGRTLIELAGEPAAGPATGVAAAGAVEDLGTLTLAGEIVDSKCFLGVMNPGNLKPHRLCAVRCISGGIPPVLYVHDADGRVAYLLLVGDDGRSINRELLGWVAEPVEVTGRVERHGDLLVLRAEPERFRRL
jgi:hypothetical protein